MFPAMLPPPTPFKLFVLAASIFEMRFWHFLLAIFAGRFVRFFVLSVLTMVMGEKQVGPLTERLLPLPVPIAFVKWFALQVPLPWPKGTKTLPEVDPKRKGNQPTEFAADLAELRRLFERFTQEPRDFDWKPHPIFGVMRDDEWQRWAYLHMDHHFRQFGV